MIDATATRRRKIRRSHSHDDERDDISTDLKTKRGTWERLHPCVVHHNKKTLKESDYSSETEPETEPENDISFSSDEGSESSILLCREHREVYNAIHVRRSTFLKPSTGDVEIIPMPKPDEHMGDAIESEASSTTSQLEEERAPPDIDECVWSSSFTWFRINYVLVMSAIMLADGLQGRCHKSVRFEFSSSLFII